MISRDEASKIAKTARRSPSNEAALVWSFVGIPVIFTTLFGMPPEWLAIISLHVSILAASTMVGVLVGGVAGLVWYFIARKTVEQAIVRNNAIMKVARDQRVAETQEKIAALHAGEESK
ncbi:hypothetical protein [Halocynthiibacter sp.]|uniref:hypothetical protein n=1 Tax=Halocynthiibacter sp. TaxID=1979210 RepID=UPI003C519220